MRNKRGKKDKIISIFEILLLLTATFAFAYLITSSEISSVKAAEVTSCCERTKNGAWCQNAPSTECDSNYLSTPTSCESTSYCKLGCCYDSQEGICMENTPEKVCLMNNGTWSDSSSCSIPQCELGCCVLNGQAAFTTLTRCKKISSFYGIAVDFRKTITNELDCISLASLEDRGACVYEIDYERTCKFTTRNDCNNINTQKRVGNSTITSNATFYKDKLCSSEELATNCGMTEKTICYEGRVHFIDSCGNIANIYDSSRIKDKVYWDKVISVEQSCGYGLSNINSASCGNCNYLLGSRCGNYQKEGIKPNYGEYICRDLNCNIDGKNYKHGETWCSTDKYKDSVGSRYYRHICANGEEIIEPCADYRQQVCVEDKIKTEFGDFSQGACSVNRWHDCTSQLKKEDCLNTDQRDCKWISNKNEVSNDTIACVPLDAPGFEFWNNEAEQICNQASITCIVKYEKSLLGGKDCIENCECLSDSWRKEQEQKCQALGDCGSKVNFLGVQGKSKTTSQGKQTSSYSSNSSRGNFNNPISNRIFLPIINAVLFLFKDVKLVSGNGYIQLGSNPDDIYYNYSSGTLRLSLSLVPPIDQPIDIPSSPIEISSPTQPQPPSEQVKPFLGLTGKPAEILKGFVYAMGIVAAMQMFGRMLGLNEKQVNAASLAVFSGMMTKTLIETFFKDKGWIGKNAGLVGISAGIIVFLLSYKTESKKIVKFECHAFEAPIGGNDCEKCNNDKYPCSEYRCKSLGQACQLINKGTKEEKCVWINPKDVTSPVIQPWREILTKEHIYAPDNSVRPPAIGYKILYEKSPDKCLKAFSPITFGITTNEPTQCKIDYNHTTKFEDMQYFMGNSALFKYNHSQTLNLPSPEHLSSVEPTLKHDGTFTLYIRCKDANGNYNVDEFAVSFCVEKGPDSTAPKIEEVNPINNAPFQYNLESLEVTIFTNEPAECKWSRVDMRYEQMEYNMICYNQIYQQDNRGYYRCIANLTGLKNRENNIFYFKCKDMFNNTNTDSYVYTLRGSSPLDIISVYPNSTTISGSTKVIPVTLKVETSNGESNRGDATCYFSNNENGSFVKMFKTGTNIHEQNQDLPSGNYKYYFKCIDLAGNLATTSINFNVYVDKDPPQVIRVYRDSSRLKIVTNENASCYFSLNSQQKCNFIIEEGIEMRKIIGTEHYAEFKEGKTYYIKCKDESNNQPDNTQCSITINMPSI
ncbi:MAG: hypothetical protein QW117_01815 [Candidatus Pacearchaeota archaeon]